MLACWYVGMFSHGSRTIAHEENCPNSKTNPKPNQQAILLGGNCLDTFPHDCS